MRRQMWTIILGTSAVLLAPATVLAQGQPPRPLTPEERRELEGKAGKLTLEMKSLFYRGERGESALRAKELLGVMRTLHAGEDHPDLAEALNSVGFVLSGAGREGEALPYFQEALAMRRRLHDGQDHSDLAMVLENTGSALIVHSRYEEALPLCREAVAMQKRLWKGRDHPGVATSLNTFAALLGRMGRLEEALPLCSEALEMRRRLFGTFFPKGHPEVAQSLSVLGGLLGEMGQTERAIPHFTEALAIMKAFHRDKDNPEVAICMLDVGGQLAELGRYEQALPFFEDALAMLRRLSGGEDEETLAVGLNLMGGLLDHMDRRDEALTSFRESLEMNRRLFEGRDNLRVAAGLTMMGTLLKKMGRHEEALPITRDALAMGQRIHKGDDHPLLAKCLTELGSLLAAMGRHEEALPHFRDALRMQRRYIEREAAATSLAEALELVGRFADSSSALLSASRHVPDPGIDVAAEIWTSKSALGRLLRERHRLARLEQSESQEVRDNVTALRVNRRQLSQLLQVPSDPDRDKAVQALTDETERLERALAKVLPKAGGGSEIRLAALAGSLELRQAFVDLYRYREEADGEETSSRYVAFVLTAEGKPKRVELGPAGPIDRAVHDWRSAIVSWGRGLSPAERRGLEADTARHAAALRELVWEPIRRQLPPDPTAVYVSPDGDLARLPFAALPGSEPDTVLLEEYPIAVVPGGPFLLEHLTGSGGRPVEEGALLAVGGIDYGDAEGAGWPYLEGSALELAQVRALAGGRTVVAGRGAAATADWLLGRLPQARFAHLATHGEFREREYAEEQARHERDRGERLGGLSPATVPSPGRGPVSVIAGAGMRNPLGYVGVVMAGANGPDGGVVSGLDIVDLDLSEMQLAVLSACETGLGERTGGAGVQNLTLAFHVAGCRNVIASLWKVDDQATAALMAKFYHELWVNKKPAIEALREAQLLVYRRPDLIADLAGTRGAPRQQQAVAAEVADPTPRGQPEGPPRRTQSGLWAAFVLSGVGR